MTMPHLDHRFAYHRPTTKARQDAHELVRALVGSTATTLDRELPDGREKALVLTKLEEAMFWANAAIARQPNDLAVGTRVVLRTKAPAVKALNGLKGEVIAVADGGAFPITVHADGHQFSHNYHADEVEVI